MSEKVKRNLMTIAGNTQPEKINSLTAGIKQLSTSTNLNLLVAKINLHDLKCHLKVRHNKYTI